MSAAAAHGEGRSAAGAARCPSPRNPAALALSTHPLAPTHRVVHVVHLPQLLPDAQQPHALCGQRRGGGAGGRHAGMCSDAAAEHARCAPNAALGPLVPTAACPIPPPLCSSPSARCRSPLPLAMISHWLHSCGASAEGAGGSDGTYGSLKQPPAALREGRKRAETGLGGLFRGRPAQAQARQLHTWARQQAGGGGGGQGERGAQLVRTHCWMAFCCSMARCAAMRRHCGGGRLVRRMGPAQQQLGGGWCGASSTAGPPRLPSGCLLAPGPSAGSPTLRSLGVPAPTPRRHHTGTCIGIGTTPAPHRHRASPDGWLTPCARLRSSAGSERSASLHTYAAMHARCVPCSRTAVCRWPRPSSWLASSRMTGGRRGEERVGVRGCSWGRELAELGGAPRCEPILGGPRPAQQPDRCMHRRTLGFGAVVVGGQVLLHGGGWGLLSAQKPLPFMTGWRAAGRKSFKPGTEGRPEGPPPPAWTARSPACGQRAR